MSEIMLSTLRCRLHLTSAYYQILTPDFHTSVGETSEHWNLTVVSEGSLSTPPSLASLVALGFTLSAWCRCGEERPKRNSAANYSHSDSDTTCHQLCPEVHSKEGWRMGKIPLVLLFVTRGERARIL